MIQQLIKSSQWACKVVDKSIYQNGDVHRDILYTGRWQRPRSPETVFGPQATTPSADTEET